MSTEWIERFAADRRLTAPAEFWHRLAAAYGEPERHYHNLDHLRELFEHFAAIEAGPGWRRPREVVLAMLLHDAVYVAGSTDNEKRSGELARSAIAEIWPAQAGESIDAEHVVELIERTAEHGKASAEPRNDDTGHFLDADMAILAAPEDRFDEYDRQIRLISAPAAGDFRARPARVLSPSFGL